jgi:hypothetical protein
MVEDITADMEGMGAIIDTMGIDRVRHQMSKVLHLIVQKGIMGGVNITIKAGMASTKLPQQWKVPIKGILGITATINLLPKSIQKF